MKNVIIIMTFLVLLGCENQNQLSLRSGGKDQYPPELLLTKCISRNEVEMTFSEPAIFKGDDFSIDSGVHLSSYHENDENILLKFNDDFIPGKKYLFHCTVEDKNGNKHTFIECFYGKNERIPQVVINEFNPKGSGNNPDCIELAVLSDGNTGGVVLIWGSPSHKDYAYSLPPVEVKSGDFIIVHCQPEFLDGEITEISEQDASKGKLSCNTAWDFWLPEKQGISGNNGVFVLCESMHGNVMDCVLYSNRTYKNDDYYGWTSTTFDAVKEISELGLWETDHEIIYPEEAIFSGNSTSTRSLCRDSLSTDCDFRNDWHTVPTSMKSFGSVNTDEVYIR